VGTVNLQAVEAEKLADRAAFTESADHVVNIPMCHWLGDFTPGLASPEGPTAPGAKVPPEPGAKPTCQELGERFTAYAMDFLDHTLPSSQGLLAVEMRHIWIDTRSRMRNVGPLRDDQAYSAFGPAAIIGCHFPVREFLRATWSASSRHYDPVG